MGIWSIFKRKKKQTNTIDDEMREMSLDVRRKKSELRQLHIDLEIEEAKQELNLLRSEQFQENPEMMIFQMFSKLMTKGQDQKQNAPISHPEIKETTSKNENLVLSRQQIQTFFKGLPDEHKEMIKYASDEQLKEVIRSKIPAISEESLDLCVIVARENQ